MTVGAFLLSPVSISPPQGGRGFRRGSRPEVCGHLVDVAAEDRCEISVDHRRVAAPDELHQRRDLVADGDLREAVLAGEPRDRRFVRGIFPRMHEDDGERTITVGLQTLEDAADLGFIGRRLNSAVGAHPLVDLLDARVEQLGEHDFLGEDIGARLVADPERIAETARDDERRALALPLQKRVGGDGRPHLHRADPRARDRGAWSDAKQPADRLDRRVVVDAGILRQKLRRGQPAFGVARHDIGEGAAAIDPEIPPARALCRQEISPLPPRRRAAPWRLPSASRRAREGR